MSAASLEVEGLGHTTNEAFAHAKRCADLLTHGDGDWIVTDEDYRAALVSELPVHCRLRLQRIEVQS